MADLFQNKYRIPSTRLKNWEYGGNGVYFITICTKNRKHYFGEIEIVSSVKTQNFASLQQTPIGQSASDCWYIIPDHFPFVLLDEFVVMPNHVHGILVINKTQQPSPLTGNRFGPQSKNLASILRGYKIGVTNFARDHNLPFHWQPRFHDHIIRNEGELERIRKYIRNNPDNWKEDNFYG